MEEGIMNNQFNIGDIIINNNLSRDDRHWIVVGFVHLKKLRGWEYYYQLVSLEYLDTINNPFEMEIEHIHDNYKKVS
jgi:hypothetical protein